MISLEMSGVALPNCSKLKFPRNNKTNHNAKQYTYHFIIKAILHVMNEDGIPLSQVPKDFEFAKFTIKPVMQRKKGKKPPRFVSELADFLHAPTPCPDELIEKEDAEKTDDKGQASTIDLTYWYYPCFAKMVNALDIMQHEFDRLKHEHDELQEELEQVKCSHTLSSNEKEQSCPNPNNKPLPLVLTGSILHKAFLSLYPPFIQPPPSPTLQTSTLPSNLYLGLNTPRNRLMQVGWLVGWAQIIFLNKYGNF